MLTIERDPDNVEVSTVEFFSKVKRHASYKGRDQRFLSGCESCRDVQVGLHSQEDVTLFSESEK